MGYVNVNGLEMYYEVHGEGKPIVLLHGLFMNIPRNWGHILPILMKDRKVIAPEMQGHGRTRDISRQITFEGMADDVSDLLKHLKIDSADILGYSMGAGVAFQLAMRHPKNVRKLVVLSGPYAHDGWWSDVEASFSILSADMFKGTTVLKEYISFGNDSTKFPGFLKKVINSHLKNYDWFQEVKNIEAPLFIAIGDSDGIRYEHVIDLFRAIGGGKMGDIHGLPRSRLAILPGTTHLGMIQQLEWLLPKVIDFMDSD